MDQPKNTEEKSFRRASLLIKTKKGELYTYSFKYINYKD